MQFISSIVKKKKRYVKAQNYDQSQLYLEQCFVLTIFLLQKSLLIKQCIKEKLKFRKNVCLKTDSSGHQLWYSEGHGAFPTCCHSFTTVDWSDLIKRVEMKTTLLCGRW